MALPSSTSLQTSETRSYGDTSTATRGNAQANIGLVNAVFGRGNQLAATAAAGSPMPTWVWVVGAAVIVGGFAWILLRKK